MIEPELSPAHQRFVAEYLIDCNATRAAIRAGYAPRSASSTGSRLLSNPDIAADIARRQAEIAEQSEISVKSLLAEAEGARAVAEAAGNGSAMVAAVALKAKIAGLLVERVEDAVERDKLLAGRAQATAFRSAGRLLAEAAESLGLPADATPCANRRCDCRASHCYAGGV